MLILRLALTGLLALAPLRASAFVQSSPDMGGMLNSYIKQAWALRDARERTVIDAPCGSACTARLLLVRHGLLCATPRASFLFHASPDSTAPPSFYAAWASLLPAGVRRWVIAHRGFQSSTPVTLSGEEMFRAGVPRCG